MLPDRRQFLERAAVGAAAFAGLTAIPADVAAALSPGQHLTADDFDMSWTRRITGKNRAVFDVPEVDSAYGVWRTQFWASQLQEVFKTPATEISTVLVLRHNAINLAMQQEFWDKYGVAKAHPATHPVTQQATERNPALLSSARGEVPAQFDGMALDKVISRGTIALGCNLALEFDVVPKIVKADGVSTEEARKRARAYMIPGVILQPSGVFAALVAQDHGCRYIRAS